MSFHFGFAISIAIAIQLAFGQVPTYGQCGGANYHGPTGCEGGSTCLSQNEGHSQCVPLLEQNVPSAGTFKQPIIYEDLADLDILNVNGTYYYSSSTMHYSPGAPILRSYDLANWEYIGHSVPTLDFGDNDSYNLVNGKRAYVRGVWASTLRYRAATNTWYWLGCVDFSKTYIYTANSVTGPWKKSSVLNTCYYDCGLLIDDDGTMYVAYGNTNISVAQLSSDGLSQVKTQVVYPSSFYIEGSRFYKRDGAYYIFTTQPASAEWVLKSTSGPFGPYALRPLVQSVAPPISGAGNPHQGGIVQTSGASSNWYYVAFIDSYPGGRSPVLAPLTWGSDGWPSVTLDSGNKWGTSYANPLPSHPLAPLTGTDTFTSIGPQWEFNHNPDTSKFSVGNGLVLQTATITVDLYSARNTLTHRILGPKSSGTILVDFSRMTDGDRAGLALFRHFSAWIGIQQTGSSRRVVFVNGLTMNSDWVTNSTGTVAATGPTLSGTEVYLRLTADISPGGTKTATFAYSSDGSTFTTLGSPFTMDPAWQFFMGYRFGIFNYATKALGGFVTIKSFTLANA